MTGGGTSSRAAGAGSGARYRLFAPIGAGGMGTVYLGRLLSSANFARTVAIKRPLPELARDPEFRESIRREARVAARVHHPNVVATLDVADVEGELWVVMEYVHGPTLATLFTMAREREQALPLDVALALVEGVLRGLEAVHSARDERGAPLGVVHRDLSPHNVLCGSDGMARVADFGLARAEAMTSITHSARFKGKLAYASPEQVESLALTPASDLYSAGVMLWELLTGQRLYSGATATETIARLLSAPVPAPSSLRPHLPGALDAIVLQALERDPKRRYATASEMLDALKRARAAASVDAVALWLRAFAGDWMAERERLLSAAERGDGVAATDRADRHGSSERDPSRVVTSSERASGSRALLRGAGLAAGLSLVWFGADFMLNSARRAAEPGPLASIEPLRAEGGGSEIASGARAARMDRGERAAGGAGLTRGEQVSAFDAGASVATSAPARRSVEQGSPRSAAGPSRARLPSARLRATARSHGADAVAPLRAPAASGADAAVPPRPPLLERAVACDPPYSVDADGIRHMRPGCE